MAKIEETKGAGKPALKSRKEINREGRRKLMADLNAAAKAKGWKGISEYLTAVRNGRAVIPQKQN